MPAIDNLRQRGTAAKQSLGTARQSATGLATRARTTLPSAAKALPGQAKHHAQHLPSTVGDKLSAVKHLPFLLARGLNLVSAQLLKLDTRIQERDKRKQQERAAAATAAEQETTTPVGEAVSPTTTANREDES
ncbi:hypothetical protein GCM10023215_47220 [Pseudonocardia yuanmonensis]|uniref:Uncharacterized protein n=1 Tax=Pseudonocardia yuanmonensis TaxID=1095914 RepID=A0ABP8X8B2_9PSEU